MDDVDLASIQSIPDRDVWKDLERIRVGLPVDSDDALQVRLGGLVSRTPRIVTKRWLDQHADAHPEVAILRNTAEALAAGHRPWPWGLGPIERVFGNLDKSFGLRAAQTLARSAAMTTELGPTYLRAATASIYEDLEAGRLQEAARHHEVLLAAVEPDGVEDAREARRRVWSDWLDVAGKLLAEYHDDRIYGLAVAADSALANLATDDPDLQADIAYRFAGMLLAPLVTLGESVDRFYATVQRRIAVGPAYADPDPARPVARTIPSALESLELAQRRLSAVLELELDPRKTNLGRLRLMLVNAMVYRDRLLPVETRTPMDDARIVEARSLARQAADELRDNDFPMHFEALALCDALGANVAAVDVPTIPHADDLIARWGPAEATRIVIMGCQLLRVGDPERALAVMAEFAGVARGLDEDRRASFLRAYLGAVFDPEIARKAVSCNETDGRALSAAALVDRVSQRAQAEGWSRLDTARALALAATDVVPGEAIAAMEHARTLMPAFSALHVDAFDYHLAATAAGLHQRVYHLKVAAPAVPGNPYDVERGGDAPEAIALLAEALQRFVALGMPGAALEALQVMQNMVVFGQPGAALLIVDALVLRLHSLEVLAGERCYAAAARLMRHCMGQLLTECGAPGCSFDAQAVLAAALSLSKGHALASLISTGIDHRFGDDPELRQLMGDIGRRRSPDEDEAGPLDEFRLVSCYSGAQEERAGATPYSQLQGLRHSFDAALYRALLRAATPSARMAQLTALPDDTVMLVFHDAEMNGPKLVSFLFSSGPLIVGTQPINEAAMTIAVRDEPALPGLGTLASVVLRLRERLLDEPWDDEVAASAAYVLQTWTSIFMGPVEAKFAELFAAGKRRLLVVPHGPLHVFPFHLVGPPGKPLCGDWSIRYLPVIGAAGGPVGRRGLRRSGVAAFGIDFHGYPGGRWAELDNAPSEAERIADGVPGAVWLTNEKATRNAVAHALERSRWVHLSTHGQIDAYAPCFNAIVLWPANDDDGKLTSHQLLRLDLRGLELVTLSACDLALGRFDAADNVRSIPATLLALGVGSVIGALWPIDAAVSETFFVALYGSLTADASIEEAFCRAQRETRARHRAYRDWGAFVLHG